MNLYRIKMGGIAAGWHLLVGYSPCMICCSDSVVRGMFVVLAESRQERNKDCRLWEVLTGSTLPLCLASYLEEIPI